MYMRAQTLPLHAGAATRSCGLRPGRHSCVCTIPVSVVHAYFITQKLDMCFTGPLDYLKAHPHLQLGALAAENQCARVPLTRPKCEMHEEHDTCATTAGSGSEPRQ